ncbi:hypothetical protein MNBD_BACTEROID07-1837 [hydrothermal vent metagenome]|uniref:Outer membrane protein beta-barrel domain-containing protein n=1 Tax=hydrothermal vent metagenome TaxID=652676 RepID=A0A3B0UNK8_9ZZZZ
MKKSLLLFALFVGFLTVTVKAQDTLYLKSHKQFDVKILKNTKKAVDYRFSDYPDGPVFSVKPIKISKISYKNGYVEDFGNKNPRINRPFGVSGGLRLALTYPGNLGESGTFLVSFDYFLIPQIDFQLNIGTQFSEYYFYSLGATFHLNKTNSDAHFAPFTGALLGTDYNFFPMWFIRVPVGVNYVNNWGLSASLSLSSMFYFKDYPLLTAQLKIGWRFK